MTREELPLPNPDLYAAASNWHGWVDYALNKAVAFNVEDVGELRNDCADTLLLPLFNERYCSAFVSAVSTYKWSNHRDQDSVQLVPMSELLYQVIVEGMIVKSVLPYLREAYETEGEVDINTEDIWLFLQDTNNTEIPIKPHTPSKAKQEEVPAEELPAVHERFHVLWFWTSNEEQGVNFPESSCKAYLGPGVFLVIPNTGDESRLHLIPTGVRNIGVVTSVAFYKL